MSLEVKLAKLEVQMAGVIRWLQVLTGMVGALALLNAKALFPVVMSFVTH